MVGSAIVSTIVPKAMLAGRLGQPALNIGFKTPEVERNANGLTKGGRKYVSLFDDDASST
jgi:hypothetical protein